MLMPSCCCWPISPLPSQQGALCCVGRISASPAFREQQRVLTRSDDNAKGEAGAPPTHLPHGVPHSGCRGRSQKPRPSQLSCRRRINQGGHLTPRLLPPQLHIPLLLLSTAPGLPLRQAPPQQPTSVTLQCQLAAPEILHADNVVRGMPDAAAGAGGPTLMLPGAVLPAVSTELFLRCLSLSPCLLLPHPQTPGTPCSQLPLPIGEGCRLAHAQMLLQRRPAPG